MLNRGLVPVKGFMVLTPAQIGDYWDMMVPGLKKVRKLGGEDWRIEDLYHSLKLGNSTALVSTINEEGFLVFTKTEDFLGPLLWVWAVYAAPGTDVSEYWAGFKRLAKDMNITRCCFSSKRIGWFRRAYKYGFTPLCTVYQLEIES